MIGLLLVCWVLLTACGEYLLHEASFLGGWRKRMLAKTVQVGTNFQGPVFGPSWMAKMLRCFACPWGWSSLGAGLFLGLCVVLWFVNPWSVLPLAIVSLPALGLGLSRIVALLSPMAAWERAQSRQGKSE